MRFRFFRCRQHINQRNTLGDAFIQQNFFCFALFTHNGFFGFTIFRILRQCGKTQHPWIAHIIRNDPDTVAAVSFNRTQTIDNSIRLCGNAHTIWCSVPVFIKENDVAFFRKTLSDFAVQFSLCQFLDPAYTVGIIRYHRIGNLRIIQTEADKHGGPVTVGIAVPLTKSSYSLDLSVFVGDGLLLTLLIAQLTACNRQKIIRPNTGQFDIRNGALPIRLGFKRR